MRKLTLCLTALLLFTLFANHSFAQTFNKQEISFIIPEGWTLTEEEDFDGKGYYLSIEKDGELSSGLVTISWLNDTPDLYDIINMYIDNIVKNHQETSGAKVKFDKTVPVMFRDFNAIKTSYRFSINNIPHEGEIICFNMPGKTMTLLLQEATEDKEYNKAG